MAGGNGDSSNLPAIVVGEVVEAIRQDKSSQININILIQQVSEKAHNPSEIVAATEQALDLAEKWEQKRVQAFKDRVSAVIDAKTKDPDEVDKRQNNRVRRGLKMLIGTIAIGAVGGGIVVAATGGSIVVATLLLLVGAVSIAILGPLASGESVTASDMVSIIQATGGLVPRTGQQQNQSIKKKK